jgi:hypothetical protein
MAIQQSEQVAVEVYIARDKETTMPIGIFMGRIWVSCVASWPNSQTLLYVKYQG